MNPIMRTCNLFRSYGGDVPRVSVPSTDFPAEFALRPLSSRTRPAAEPHEVAEAVEPPVARQPIVRARHVSKRYGEFPALDDLTLDIPAGGIFALLGPNGAGKTTLMKILMGMLQPSGGELTVGGMNATKQSVAVKRIVGYLPDEPVFYDFMRGREIIRFVGEMHGLDRQTIRTRSLALADRLQLTDALEEFAENYSRGMKKKLGLICALLHEPDLVVLDEPTNGLDPHGTQVLHELMREVAAAGRTVLFSTHLLDQAQRLCSRVAIVHRGRLAAEGTLDELRARVGTNESLEELFFRLTGSVTAEAPAHDTTGEGA